MNQTKEESKSAKKFWWILMLLPVGLGIGTVTSLVQHLRKSDMEESQERFTVTEEITLNDLLLSYKHAQLIGDRRLEVKANSRNIQTAKNFIQGSVSPGGVGLTFTDNHTPRVGYESLKTAHVEIPGRNPKQAIAIVIELAGPRSQAEAIKLALTPPLMRSLANTEAQQSIYVVLSPLQTSPEEHQKILQKLWSKTQLTTTVVVKTSPTLELDYHDQWFELQHPTKGYTATKAAHLASATSISHPSLSDSASNPESMIYPTCQELRALVIQLANRR